MSRNGNGQAANGNGRPAKLLTPEDVIDILRLDADGCTPEQARERLRNRCRSRGIPHVKLGRLVRFKPADIQRLIDEHTIDAVDS